MKLSRVLIAVAALSLIAGVAPVMAGTAGPATFTKTADSATVTAGDPIGFTLTATAGLSFHGNVTVTDQLPVLAGLDWSITSSTGSAGLICTISPGDNLTCTATVMLPNTSHSVHVTSATTGAYCGVVHNDAEFKATAGGLVDLSASAETTIRCPDITLTKTPDAATVPAGSQAGFMITATNSSAAGTGEARNVKITDSLTFSGGIGWSIDGANSDAGCSIATPGAPLDFTPVLTCNFGTLAPGATRKVHIQATTNASFCFPVNNTAHLSMDNGPSGQASATVNLSCGTIGLTKTADATSVAAGGQIGFVITASHSGVGPARNVQVTDTLPVASGLNWTIDGANSDSGCSIGGGTLTCEFGDLTAASKHVHLVSPTTTGSCSQISNTANMTTINDGGAQASASVTVTCPTPPPAPVIQIDGRIRRPGGHIRGNNIYNATADGQRVRLRAFAGDNRVAWISIQNEGNVASSYKVAASAGSAPGFSIQYLVGLTDVTAAVENGTFQTLSVAAGDVYRLRVIVTYTADVPRGSLITRLVTITSVDDSTKTDTVGFVARRV